MKSQCDLVVFDIAGTTVNDGNAVAVCLGEALSAAGVEYAPERLVHALGLPKPMAIKLLLESAQVSADPETVSRLHADFRLRLLNFIRTHPDVQEIPGAEQTFASLKKAGIKIGLCTGFDSEITRAVLARMNWDHSLIDAVVCSDQVKRGRPHGDMVWEIMRELDLSDASRVAKVGDTAADLGEGRDAECRWNIAVLTGASSEQELRSHHPTHVLASIVDLPQLLLSDEKPSVEARNENQESRPTSASNQGEIQNSVWQDGNEFHVDASQFPPLVDYDD